MTTLRDVQLQREQEMVHAGIQRYYDSIDEQSASSPGQQLLRRALPILTEAIRDFIDSADSPRAGRRQTAAVHLQGFDPAVVAYITLRTAINDMVKPVGISTTAVSLSRMLEHHARTQTMSEVAPKVHQKVMNSTSKHARHRKYAVSAAHRRLGIGGPSWDESIRLHVGMRLLELMEQHTELVQDVVIQIGGGKSQHRLVPSPKVEEWLRERHGREALLHPVYRAMVVPPVPWSHPLKGGYLSDAMPRVSMVRTGNLDDIFSTSMPEVYAAINAVQETPWRINKGVLSVFRELIAGGSELAKLPFGEDEELPPRPEDIPRDVPISSLDEVTKARLRKYNSECAAVYGRNARKVSKRFACLQVSSLAEDYAQFDRIYFPMSLDFRGRMYPVPTGLTPQGDDLSKGLLEFADGKPLGDGGLYWLFVHAANCWGHDKLPLDDRADWARQNLGRIMDSGIQPLDGKRFWLDAESPWQALAVSMEIAGAMTAEDSRMYVSHLPIGMDGSCSGLQHYSAMLRDPIGAAAVNLEPSDECADIYTSVSRKVSAWVDASCRGTDPDPMALAWQGKVIRKIVKQPTMTFAYSVTHRGMRDQIVAALQKLDDSGGYLGDTPYYAAATWLAPLVDRAIRQTVVAASEAMQWLQEVARAATEEGLPLYWCAPTGFPVLQDQRRPIGKRVKVYYGGQPIKLTLQTESPRLDAKRQASGIAPNLVHSMDAAHLMRTVIAAREAGIRHFAMVHDSFGVHAADTTEFNTIIRREFIRMYQQDVLAEFREGMQSRMLGELPPSPSMGTFDLDQVMDSDFFFS